MSISDIFRNGGLLSKRITGYEERKGQIDLVSDLETFLNSGNKTFIGEGPVGVGKSMAYLLSSLIDYEDGSYKFSDNKVLISTSSITLQNQLVNKDLEDTAAIVEKQTGKRIKFCSLKGIGNYICLRNFQKYKDFANDETKKILKEHEGGEKPDQLEWELWDRITTTSSDCDKKECPFFHDCHYQHQKAKAAEADVLVVNHSLLLADLYIRNRTQNEVSVLPKSDTLVVDEAHHLSDSCTLLLKEVLSKTGVLRMDTKVKAIKEKIKDLQLDDQTIMFLISLTQGELGLYDKINLQKLIDFINDRFKKRGPNKIINEEYPELKQLSNQFNRLSQNLSSVSYEKDGKMVVPNPVRSLATLFEDYAQRLNALINNPDDIAIWTEGDSENPKIALAPIDVSDFLSILWKFYPKNILVSATMAVEGKFDYIKRELGLPEDAEGGIYESPFDYRLQARMIIPPNANPSSRKHDHDDEVFRTIAAVTKNSYDKTLVLFTSIEQMNNVMLRVRRELGDEYTILEQSKNMSKEFILNKFRKEDKVILGAQAASFGTGVDVKGNKNLILAKLNFDNPTDPLIKARSSRNENYFMNVSLPTVCIRTKQQIGRAIRSSNDNAVILIVDGRILRSHWGRIVKRSLPDMRFIEKRLWKSDIWVNG